VERLSPPPVVKNEKGQSLKVGREVYYLNAPLLAILKE
jgi:hypothetical protein